MKKNLTLLISSLLFTCFSMQVMGQEASKGIAFEKEGTLFRQAVQKALSQQKLIFLDCYTSWCGPCKMMANKVFPQETVGNFMNPKYVSIKIDMEKGEGPELAKKFQVTAYPTFIIFNSGGQELGRFLGGSDAEKFIANVKKASVDNGSAEMDKRFADGERDEAFLYEYLKTLSGAYKRDQCNAVAEALLEGKAETFATNKQLGDIFMKHLSNPLNPAFIHTAQHPETLAATIENPKAVEMKLLSVWRNYPRNLIIEANGTVTLDQENFDKWQQAMKDCKVEKNVREDLRLTTLMTYYEKTAAWDAYVKCIKEYGKDMDIPDLMLAKWSTPIVRNCQDAAPRAEIKTLLQKRLEDLKSGKRAPQTHAGNMKLSGNMDRAFQMLIDGLDGKQMK